MPMLPPVSPTWARPWADWASTTRVTNRAATAWASTAADEWTTTELGALLMRCSSHSWGTSQAPSGAARFIARDRRALRDPTSSARFAAAFVDAATPWRSAVAAAGRGASVRRTSPLTSTSA